MLPPDDAPPAARLSRWLDGWLEPRWRALLTWVVLAGLMNWVSADLITWRRLRDASKLYFETVNGALDSPIPHTLWAVSFGSALILLHCWFEPLLLRLSLARGFAWIGLRIVPIVVIILLSQGVLNLTGLFLLVPVPALSMVVLRGWRSRSWVSAIGTVLMVVANCYLLVGEFRTRSWLDGAAVALPYAVVLLYGTRLLTPEERAQGRGD